VPTRTATRGAGRISKIASALSGRPTQSKASGRADSRLRSIGRLDDDTGALVPEDDRPSHARMAALENVDIRATDTGELYLERDLTGPWTRVGNVLHVDVAITRNDGLSHAPPSVPSGAGYYGLELDCQAEVQNKELPPP
jgi:hypothetical protein